MNRYEERQEARRDRLQAGAERRATEGNEHLNRAREMSSAIPFGQPMLVDHHSYGRDRRYRERIHNNHRKGFEKLDEAAELQRRAEAVGTGGISSDDPEAVTKLREQLAGVEASQVQMKAANAVLRKHKSEPARLAALQALGFTEDQAREAIKPDFCGRIGFPGYALSNNNANARRIRARIKELEARAVRQDKTEEHDGFTYVEDIESNRVMFRFPDRVDAEVRSYLKARAFKWAPTRGAWVRQLTPAAINTAADAKKWLAEKLKA